MASVNLEYSFIRAPFSGVILTKNADKGEIVATLDAAEATRDQLGLLMAGARLEESVEPA